MGLGSFLDPGNAFGGLSGETGADAAGAAAEITNAELLRQFELSQENLRPTLEAAQRQLPGIESQLTTQGFGDSLAGLDVGLNDFLGGTVSNRSNAGMDQLSMAGIDVSGLAPDLGLMDSRTVSDLLLGAEADLFGNRLSLSGIGEGAGTVLSQLGQRTGAGMAEANINADVMAQQSKAQGKSNALGIASLFAAFSDERLKDDIEDIGEYKGVRLIKWNWKECVPDSWRGVTVGFSAQDILNKFPQFVTERNGFLAIDKDGLINHLEAI